MQKQASLMVIPSSNLTFVKDTMGSPQYAAPELNTAHDNKVDVFSFAIV
jgi:hypothetical protein